MDDGSFGRFTFVIKKVLLQFSFLLYLGRGRGNNINKRNGREISELIRPYKLHKFRSFDGPMYWVEKGLKKEYRRNVVIGNTEYV